VHIVGRLRQALYTRAVDKYQSVSGRGSDPRMYVGRFISPRVFRLIVFLLESTPRVPPTTNLYPNGEVCGAVVRRCGVGWVWAYA